MANRITKIQHARVDSKKILSVNDKHLSEVIISDTPNYSYNTDCYLVDKKEDKKYVLDILGVDPVENIDTSTINYVMYPVANKVFKGVIALYQPEFQQYVATLSQYTRQVPMDMAISLLPFSTDTSDTELWKGFSNTWYMFSLETIGVFEKRASISSIMGMTYLKLTNANDGNNNFNFAVLQIDADFINSDVFINLQKNFKKVVVETSIGTGYVLYDGIGPNIEYKQVVTNKGSRAQHNLYNNSQPVLLHRISFDSLEEFKLSTEHYAYDSLIPTNPNYPTSNPFTEGDIVIIGDPEHFKINPAWLDYSNTIYIDNIGYDECDINTMPTEENPHGYIYLRKVHLIDNSTCLTGDTLIKMADKTYQRLDQLHISDLVWTPNGPEHIIFTDSSANKIAHKYTEYSLSNGAKLKVVNAHRFYNLKKNKFIKSTHLKLGDTLLTDTNMPVKITNITDITETVNHYTLITENCNKYFANGILTGNRASNIRLSWIRKLYLKLFLWWIRRN